MVGKARLRVEGLNHVPTSGPAVIANPASTFAASLPLVAAADRRVLVAAVSDPSKPLDRLALRSSLVVIRSGDTEWIGKTARQLAEALRQGEVAALPIELPEGDAALLWAELFAVVGQVPVVPAAIVAASGRKDRSETWVYFGEPLPVSDFAAAAAAVRRLAESAQ
jgi:hypothetical protein